MKNIHKKKHTNNASVKDMKTKKMKFKKVGIDTLKKLQYLKNSNK